MMEPFYLSISRVSVSSYFECKNPPVQPRQQYRVFASSYDKVAKTTSESDQQSCSIMKPESRDGSK